MKKLSKTGLTGRKKVVTRSNKLNEEINFLQGVRTYLVLGFEFLDGDRKGLPEFPQFLYTLTGEWKGWNNLFGNNNTSDTNNIENSVQDEEDKNLFKRIILYILENEVELPDIQYKRLWEQISE
jgi:hypothetical protein